MSVKRYDFDGIPDPCAVIGLPRADGEYVRHSDYTDLLARHTELVEAVKEEIAARDHDYYDYFWRCNDATTEDELRENYAKLDAARAEVGRLVGEE